MRASCLQVDGVPVVDMAKYQKLLVSPVLARVQADVSRCNPPRSPCACFQGALRKQFSPYEIVDINMPVAGEPQMTTGCVFIECKTAELAKQAIAEQDNRKFDKARMARGCCLGRYVDEGCS